MSVRSGDVALDVKVFPPFLPKAVKDRQAPLGTTMEQWIFNARHSGVSR